MLANEIRINLLSAFPDVKKESINIDIAYLMQNFICKATIYKSLISYLLKMDSIEIWTLNYVIKDLKDLRKLNKIHESLPIVLKGLSPPIKPEIVENLNYILLRVPIIQCIYIVRYLDSIDSEFVNKLVNLDAIDAKLLTNRLYMVMKTFHLTNIFSAVAFEKIIKILGKNYNGQVSYS